jgi:DNA invertase Pin-like site-specific DNA recombinase
VDLKATRDRVAIYVRASTLEQDLVGQRKAMVDEARRRGWNVTAIYAEAKSSRAHRSEFERMYNLAMQRRHDAVFVWRLDRLGRGLLEVVGRVRELHDQGVQVVSVRDGAIDTSSAAGQFQLATLAAAAEYERELIRERTREGLARARAAGKKLGRPGRDDPALSRAMALHEYSSPAPPVRECARQCGVPESTLRRALERRAKNGVRKSVEVALAQKRAFLRRGKTNLFRAAKRRG